MVLLYNEFHPTDTFEYQVVLLYKALPTATLNQEPLLVQLRAHIQIALLFEMDQPPSPMVRVLYLPAVISPVVSAIVAALF